MSPLKQFRHPTLASATLLSSIALVGLVGCRQTQVHESPAYYHSNVPPTTEYGSGNPAAPTWTPPASSQPTPALSVPALPAPSDADGVTVPPPPPPTSSKLKRKGIEGLFGLNGNRPFFWDAVTMLNSETTLIMAQN